MTDETPSKDLPEADFQTNVGQLPGYHTVCWICGTPIAVHPPPEVGPYTFKVCCGCAAETWQRRTLKRRSPH